MAEPFLGEVRLFGFNFPPRGWAQCDGALLPINQYQALFSILGTTYGGDGRTTFGLPELRGRAAAHKGALQGGGADFSLGQKLGAESIVLQTDQIPPHTHTLHASGNNANSNVAAGNLWATAPNTTYHSLTPGGPTALSAQSVGNVGGSPHENMHPFQTVNFCIAVQGTFPSRN
ncbi:phage tail collar domain-containing protein [Rhodopirellula maiorica SM1]|uniref:Phage tail collar domain-containing protein n=1 Tax=Rhodopirellula maiorica SM1 TaxID=1265738 RepID=M5RNB1_9BACT|nr:tail fiber protein [Rhodopirellula maiorica]EMI20780.1 phage tail collar domain-containing protein [Rhodopirellula maiorica SM1]